MMHSKSLGTIKSTNSICSEEGSRRFVMENGDVSLSTYKRRKVSAVRDFPPSCGRVSTQINLRQTENTTCAGTTDDLPCRISEVTNNLDVHVVALNQISDSLVGVPEIPITLDLHVDTHVVESVADQQAMSIYREDGPRSIDVGSLNVQSEEDLHDLKGSDSISDGKSIAHDTSILPKDLHARFLLENNAIDCSVSVSNGCSLEKVAVRNFPPRTRVSAVRDFPPFCGRNAPRLCKNENVKECASENEKNLEREISGYDAKPSNEIVITYAKKKGESNQQGISSNEFLIVDKVQADSNQVKSESDRDVNTAIISLDERLGKKVVHEGDISTAKKLSYQYVSQSRRTNKSFVSSEISSDRVVVQALMASSHCPWRQGKSSKRPESCTSEQSKGKKHASEHVEKIKSVSSKKSKMMANATRGGTNQLLIQDEDRLEHGNDELRTDHRRHSYDVSVIPFGRRNLIGNSHDSDSIVPRTRVRETLRLFQAVCRKLLQEEEARSKKDRSSHKRVDLQAAKILKEKGKFVNEGKQILGSVPGVEVGDEFRYRMELNIIGLHRQIQGGIDYVKHAGKILATSIVASGGYSDDLDSSNTLIYTGQGGNVMNSGKEPEDQKLERGNLAMKNSFDERNSVRVIRGYDISEGRTYVYDGLYLIEKWWQELGPHGKLVFKFLLNRISNQPELAWKEVKKSKTFKLREGLCVDDISQGKESCPISTVNTIDDEKPPAFTYITRIVYPDWYRPIPPVGCDCSNGCSDSEKCSCAVMNGGEIPYNYNEAIVEAKPLVYECGPSCKCPSSCHNRTSQKGIKFQLEIFKTKSRGWGVRSLSSIPSGSFICEYIGELIDEKEAEQRSNDEYLFDIGNNYNDSSVRDGLSTLMPHTWVGSSKLVEDGNFTIDAAEFGNVGRFINHCCTPNLYAQNVLYDCEDKRIPHIMFFAAENIPPLQELTYHYNYMIDEVRDENGNIKKKNCYCGSVECTGRMY